MNKNLTFIQILGAVLVGILMSDLVKQVMGQCGSRDMNACTETRVECVWNSRKHFNVIFSCFTESKV